MLCAAMMAAMGVQGQQLAPYWGNARAAVSYTFDDGLIEHYTMVLPRLDSLGVKGTFWIIGHKIDENIPELHHAPMTWAMVRELAVHGHEIASHGYNHIAMNTLTHEQMASEIALNDSAIYVHTGLHPVSFCFPGNGRNDEVVNFVLSRPGIVGARTYEIGIGGKATVESLDAWLDEALQKGSWVIGMTHGITHGWDHFDNPDALWQHLAHARRIADTGKLWIATFAQVTAYQKGLTYEATYILENKPRSVTQCGRPLQPYQSWDGTWCVNALRHHPIIVTY